MNSLSTKIHYLLLFASLFGIISCNEDELVYPKGGYSYLKKHYSSRCLHILKNGKLGRQDTIPRISTEKFK